MIQEKLREKIKWGDQVYKDDGWNSDLCPIHLTGQNILCDLFS